MGNPGKQLLAGAAIINQITSFRDFTHGGLKRDPVQSNAFPPALPPMPLTIQYFGIFRLRNTVSLARFNEHLAIDRAIIQQRCDLFRNGISAAIGCVSNRYDRHDSGPPFPMSPFVPLAASGNTGAISFVY